MSLGTQISTYRKQMEMTQDALAQKLGVTNQAVSKWESEQSCPDVTLLPEIADVFGISIDELFGRAAPALNEPDLADDGVLRIRLFQGRTPVRDQEIRSRVAIHWRGPVQNLQCDCSLSCDEVQGNVQAGGNVTCDDVQGNVYAGGSVTCDCIEGSVTAGREVNFG